MAFLTWTGNPWVDTGIVAIMTLSNKQNPENINLDDLKKASNLICDLYLKKEWQTNLYSVFPNHPSTQSYGIKIKDLPKKQTKLNLEKLKQKQTIEIKKMLRELLTNTTPLESNGDCIACGRRKTTTKKNRTQIPLTGYDGSHFFSFKTNGADYCDTCSFAVQCMPLLLYACGKLALVHSNSSKVMKYWGKKCILEIMKQVSTQNFTGCFNEKYTNAINALFHILQDFIFIYDEKWHKEKASIRIYHFTNYNQGANLDIYDLPSQVFRFIAYVRQHKKYAQWRKIVRRGYNNIYNKAEEEYKNYKNTVYLALLNNYSIIEYFFERNTRNILGDWDLLKYYLEEVLSMDETRINAIRQLGDDIADLIKKTSNGKKRLGQIERASSYSSLRTVLLRLARDRIAVGDIAPLVPFENYVKYIFPEGPLTWKETQDLLLFRLYEVLHGWLISEGFVTEENENNDEEDTANTSNS